MRKVREIIRQRDHSGLSQRQIAKATGVSRPVVAQYLQWFDQSGLEFTEIREMSDSELQARIESPQHIETEEDGRYAELQSRLDDYASELGKKGVTRQLLWEEYRRAVPDGYSYTQFCFYLQLYTESDGVLSMHLSHTPGERLFIDYAGTGPQLYDVRSGLFEEQELFVATLPASGLIYCEARQSQRLADTVEATQNALWFLEGVVQALVPDNLRAAVTKADRHEPEINDTFEDMAAHYHCVVMPARGKRPRDKALVEKSVDLVYKRVLAPLRHRRFTSLSELNAAMWEKLDELNAMPMQRSGQ